MSKTKPWPSLSSVIEVETNEVMQNYLITIMVTITERDNTQNSFINIHYVPLCQVLRIQQ